MACGNRWMMILGLMLVLAAVGQGCAKDQPVMAERNVIVSLDESVPRDKAVEVNVIGANDTDLRRLSGNSVDDYWRKAGTELAQPDRKVLRLSGANRSATVTSTDPLWAKWREKGAMDLVVIALIPELSGRGQGDQDPRRVTISLDKNRWKEKGLVDIKVNVSQSGVSATQPDPPKSK